MGFKKILSIASIGIILLLAINIGITNCSYVDVESSSGNSFGAWTSSLWKQTTEVDFNSGVLTDVDISSSSGDVIIEGYGVSGSWHNNSWDYRKKITINHTKVEGDLTDFPILISLPTDPNLAIHSQADGDDIFFTTTNSIRLSHEIEEFNASTGKLTAWVKIPDISSTIDTDIYMYYGNSTCTSQENATDVWDSNFQMVHHMEETSGTHEDSTVQGNDLTPQGSIDQNAAGMIGGADYYDGINDYLSRTDGTLNGDIPAKSTGSANNYTLSAWVKLNGSLDRYPMIVKQGDWDAQMDRGFLVGATGSRNLESEVFRGNDGTNDRSDLTSTQALSADQWYYATFTYNYVTDGTSKMYIYLNGVQNGSNELAYGPPIENTRDLFIGRYFWNPYEKYFKGNIDEVRISNTVRSENWIKTSYNNQYSPSTFSSVNLEECRYDDQWSYKKKININHTKVEEDLTDFPVLINISADSDLVAHAQTDGDDILFTDSDNRKLSHEIEEFNSSTGKLIGWVKVLNLSSTTDTEVYMHYGNPSCGSQENATGVWDSNFVIVQHFNEESGTHYDSTSYSNDGSPQNGVTQNATGWISGADDFDGINDFIEVAHDDSLNMTDEVTIEAWIYPRELSGYKVMVDKTKTNSVTNYYFSVNNAAMNYGFYSSGWHESPTSNIISNDTWYHVVAVYNDTADNVRIYVNGDEKLNRVNEYGSLTTNGDALVIGKGDPGSPEEFDGIIDELRISNKARSQGWINTSYNNQYSSSTFYDIGVEEGDGPTTTGIIASQVLEADCENYNKKITIDHTKVAGNLTDFPVLISLSSDADLAAHTQDDGDDIFFTTADNSRLSHEIEEYNNSTGKLVAWMKVPNLSNTTDTDIYMHYGNPTCGSQEDVTGVWDSNFLMVQHLNDQTSTMTEDSTSNNYDGTKTAVGEPLEVEGMVGNAQYFDGANDHINVGIMNHNIGTGNYTWSVWAKTPDSFNNINPIMTNGNYAPAIYTKTYQSTEWGTYYGSYRRTGTVLSTNTWYHLVVQRENGIVRFYQDGVLLNSTHAFSFSMANSEFYIGRSGAGYYGKNTVDEARVSKIVRSESWIKTSYNNQFSPSTFYSVGPENYQINIDGLFWDETLESGTDITFEIRASDTSFLKNDVTPSWTSVGGTSPVTSGMPSGKYVQWRANLTSTGSNSPTLHEVRLYYS